MALDLPRALAAVHLRRQGISMFASTPANGTAMDTLKVNAALETIDRPKLVRRNTPNAERPLH